MILEREMLRSFGAMFAMVAFVVLTLDEVNGGFWTCVEVSRASFLLWYACELSVSTAAQQQALLRTGLEGKVLC